MKWYYYLILIACILVLVGMWKCSKKARQLGGYYRAIGVCGPVYSYFTGYMILVIPLGIIAAIICAIMGQWVMVLSGVLATIIGFLVGGLMYKSALKKCPEELKSVFLRDLLIMTFGYNCYVTFIMFYIIFKVQFELYKPRYYTDIYGNVYEAYPFTNVLYDSNTGFRVGVLNPDGTMTRD